MKIMMNVEKTVCSCCSKQSDVHEGDLLLIVLAFPPSLGKEEMNELRNSTGIENFGVVVLAVL